MPTYLRDFTSFRLGGPVAAFCGTASPAEAAEAVRSWRAEGMPFRILGSGTNILAADRGLPGEAVLRFAGGTAFPLAHEGNLWTFSAAAALDDVARFAVENAFAGMAELSGIPGTLGGAAAGNAGAYGVSLGDLVAGAEILEADGTARRVGRDGFAYDYRKSAFQDGPRLLTAVTLRLVPSPDGRGQRARREEILSERAGKHPLLPFARTAGSFFRNLPPETPGGRRRAAGALLDAVGAKSMRVGGAAVFPKHANILIADREDATAADVAALAEKLRAAVKENFGVALVPEVRWWGAVAPSAAGR
jgi:UDP-N-acetylmuramate dehydrogenase